MAKASSGTVNPHVRNGVRIVVAGDQGTGKSSLIITAAAENFPLNVPPVLPPTKLPEDIYPDHVPITIIDTSSRAEDSDKVTEELQRADAVVLTYACDRPETLENLSTFWLPHLRKLEVKVPVIVVGCKLDLRDENQQVSLELVMSPIMQQFREIETCIECSASRHIQVPEVFYYAQKAVLHPTAPLFDQESQTLKPRCVRALKRIFILCDHDRDGALSDAELNDFQVKCFNAPLQPSEIVGVKKVVQEKLSEGVNERGLTLTGFLFLHALFIEKGRLETTWTVLRKFGYNDEIKLADDLIPPLKRAPGQSVELTNEALDFLKAIFDAFDGDGVDCFAMVSCIELGIGKRDEDMFLDCSPWTGAPYEDAAEKNAFGGLSLDAFLSEWALMTLLNPSFSVENLIYIGYTGDPSSAIRVTRRRHLDRKKQHSERNVLQCFVFGPRNAGKSALLNSFIGRPYSENSNPTTEDRYAVNVVDISMENKKFLVLREIPEDGVKALLSDKESLASCDIAVFVHDRSDESSWRASSELLVEIAGHGEDTGFEVPCLIVAAKDDQDSFPMAIQESTRLSQDMGVEAPIPISVKLGDFNSLFRRIVTAAEHPHLSIPETEAGRSRKQYNRLINRSLMVVSDLTIQTEILNPLLLQCDLENHPYSIAPSEDVPNQLSENPDCIVSENITSNGIHENSPDQGHDTVPISKKILDLSTKVQFFYLGSENELLKRKLLEESSERRRLYNEVIELKGNIKVFCRCRPLNESEIANVSASVVNFDSLPDNELQVICSDSSKKQFKFDNIFRPDDNQEAVFAQTKPIVTSVLDGFNVCIFAYGQTGTGKTFTMEGTPEHRGVNYRTLEELFRLTEERHGITKYELRVSMLEVYNEKIRDLLAENSSQPTKRLEIKQAADGTQEVPGLVEAPVNGTEDVWEILKIGNGVRSVGSTCSNELSSRSHCLLRVTVVGESLINGQKTKSRLWLVDLAGSERVGKTEAEGERLKESQFINKSLSALGDVISALASKSAHIPYRNSKLTHILQSSLGGGCKTLMFVQVSPSTADLGETLCSLNFATRVRGIESGPARKQVDLTELLKYKQMAEKAKHDDKETRKLQDNLQNLQLRLAARDYHCKNLQEKVRDLENQIAEERKTRLKQESRSLAAVSAQPLSSKQTVVQKIITNKKPPLNPSKSRPPLRRITNLLPPSSPLTSKRYTAAMNGKENTVRRRNSMATNTESFSKPRNRASIAVPARQPAPSSTTQILQPRRRVSIAVLHPDTAHDVTTSLCTSPSRPSAAPTQVLQPRRRVSVATIRADMTYDIKTPLRNSASQFNSGISLQQPLRNNRRKDRYSSLFAQYSELRAASVETTPMSIGSSSKFRGSPVQANSRLARHPTGLALQRKPLVWSPLKLKGLKNNRKLLLPSRPHTEMQ
ncbi:unnamed protein product [Lupinus luteus]|uniref:Uncharacterized protein n=1 Tax=Lupinus luteus TaxID=3873 RepID=A0AAV1XI17_LUPLU